MAEVGVAVGVTVGVLVGVLVAVIEKLGVDLRLFQRKLTSIFRDVAKTRRLTYSEELSSAQVR